MNRTTLLLLITCLLGCSEDDIKDHFSSRAYKGHESDVDMNHFATAYPATIGTRLDDCQTCHTGGTFTFDKGGQTVTVYTNPCDFCHLIQHPSPDYNEPQPTGTAQTLNPYGAQYVGAGRSVEALSEIGSADADGDGFTNDEEITDSKYPGDANSKPGQEVAPAVTFTMAELQGLAAHDQFLLANSHKQEYDDYASYRGVRIVDLLTAAGVDPTDTGIQGITVFAPDGYMKDFPSAEILYPFPAGLYFAGLDNATLGPQCGFVNYPDTLPEGLVDGGESPGEQWLTLAYQRDGLAMEICNLDITSGRINGEGPFRIVVPQSDPGMPDRGSKYSPTECDDGHDYDDSKDHNAGAMVRGVTGIRINPLPAGYEDFDHQNGGWAFIDSASVIVYGYGITP